MHCNCPIANMSDVLQEPHLRAYCPLANAAAASESGSDGEPNLAANSHSTTSVTVAQSTPRTLLLALLAFLPGIFTFGCQTEQIRQIHLKKIPPALQEIVVSMDWGRQDIRIHWLEVDKKTALVVLDPIVLSWFEYRYEKLWTHNFRPWDYAFLDNSQRTVIVQVMPVRSIWDELGEYSLPNGWQPIDKIELRRDGVIRESTEVNRRQPNNTLPMPSNPGYYGFEPEWLIDGEIIELLVWRGDESTVINVPDALRQQLKEHFLIFDQVSADGVSVAPTEVLLSFRPNTVEASATLF